MALSTLARIRCYVILEGLERSLGDVLTDNYRIGSADFFTVDEANRALKRMREDMRLPTLQVDDVYPEDILQYLDLGDLVGLINRHAKLAKNVAIKDIGQLTKVINESKVLTIRKRVMHPIRALEVDDFQNLFQLARNIQLAAPSFNWTPLVTNLDKLSNGGLLFEKKIPEYWAEESPVTHNLPPAEFDETGFIGRLKERNDLKKLLHSDHRVITVVGAGGIGKTALSLRVCNDILEDSVRQFERIVWVSLKTKYLTPEGIQDIKNAIDSVGYLMQAIEQIFSHEKSNSESHTWDRTLQQMSQTKTLLVIDNLETISKGIRELAIEIPSSSKLLITSRVGLGEIEVRYELSGFVLKDGISLFRSLTDIHNYASLIGLSDRVVSNFVKSLHYNPLLIKWFVLAVGKGADPNELLKGKALDKALDFCFENVYERLTSLAKNTLAVLMSSRRELTNVQLMDLTDTDITLSTAAIQELVISSMVQRVIKDDSSSTLQIGGLVHEYLNRAHPPDKKTELKVREKIKKWQIGQDMIAVRTAVYRYDQKALIITSEDEKISAQHLAVALNAMVAGSLPEAETTVYRAEQLTPEWCEVHRVKAYLQQIMGRPIYEIEDSYQRSIDCDDNDVNRYHYAAYLLSINEYKNALEQIEAAMKCEDAQLPVLMSLKGITLMRMGQAKEAVEQMTFVWNNRSKELPAKVHRIQGTQLAEAYRRNMEQLIMKSMFKDIGDTLHEAVNVVTECMELYGCDAKLVEVAINLIATSAHTLDTDEELHKYATAITKKWDSNKNFQKHAEQYGRQHFERVDIDDYFPQIAGLLKIERSNKQVSYSGIIYSIVNRDMESYGFISCDRLGEVYFNKKSLLDGFDWNLLKEGSKIKFDIILSKAPYKPRAIKMQLEPIVQKEI